MAKTFAASYLYRSYDEYEKRMYNFIMSGTELDKASPEFEDIRYEVKKRQISNSLVKVFDSKEIIFMTAERPLDKSFKVFAAKDIKGPDKSKMKVFIDCSNIITKDEDLGKYVCKSNNIDILISYLVSAMHTLIYYADETRLTNNVKIVSTGAQAFALLFTHVVDRVCRISITPSIKNKCLYLASLYYIGNILGRDHTSEGSRKVAQKVSSLSEREAGIIDIQLKPESMTNIKHFVETVSSILHLDKLALDVVVSTWMKCYGTGTVFALEMFTVFASMITDAYVGAYVNEQKSIEKITNTSMVEFTKTILSIGAESL